MEFVIEQRIDLDGVNPVHRYDQPMEYGDGGAHRWIVWICRGKEKANLQNLTAKCFVRRAASAEEKAQGMGSVTVIQEAQVDAESGSVSCLFDAACYIGVGAVAAVMRVYDAEGHAVAAAKMTAVLECNTSDTVYDPQGLIPSLDALLAQIGAIEAATRAANEAAAKANAAADASTHPPYIDAANNHWVVWNVEANGYRDTGIAATGPMGPSGEDAPIPYIGANGNWFVAGADTGVKAQGPAGQNGTGSGTVTGIRIGDTTYEPDSSGVVLIENVGGDSLPAGGAAGQILAKKTGADGDAEWVDPPEGTLKSVCGKEADEDGDVDLTASDVGARPDTWTPNADDVGALGKDAQAKDSAKLGGQPPEYYASAGALGQLSQQKANDADLAAVAKSGSYNDLKNKPSIPSAYTLPIASSNQLGGVKPVAKTDEMTQAVGVDEEGGLWALPGSTDGISIKLLWESTNYTNTVAAHTIELDLSAYDAVLMLFYASTQSAEILTNRTIPIGERFQVRNPQGDSFYMRKYEVKQDGIVVETAYKYTYGGDGSSSANNKYNTPAIIYGIKGVEA